ncbi:MAG: alpha/beta hydrolase, partial [Pseudomonadota bacterium]
ARAPLDTFAGLDGAVVPPDVCAAWGAPRRPGREVAPTVSSVPTLIIAGEFDPDTPPKWADVAAAGLSRSRTIVVPYGLHTETTRWGGDGCAMSIAAAFFDDEDAFLASPEASPDAPTACLAARTPPDFAVE